MEILSWIIANWEVVTGAIAIIVSWNKDKIMNKLNIKLKTADVTKAERDVDTVYISNSEKLVEIYSKSMDDLTNRHRMEIKEIKEEHARNIKEFKDEAKQMTMSNQVAKEENKTLHDTVEKLTKQVSKLERFIEKLGKRIRFYEENSDVELPHDLKD